MPQQPENLSPPIVALAGWLVPGAGYWLIGQRARGVTVGVTIVLVFVLGILISGIRVVQAPELRGSASIRASIFNRPWFIGQVLNGPLGIGAAIVSDQLAQGQYKTIESKARLAEIGTLYTAVAGMLNLLTIIDSSARAASAERKRG